MRAQETSGSDARGVTTAARDQGQAVDRDGRPLPLAYTFALAAVIVAAGLYGLFVDGAYPAPEGVRPTLPETLRGQDVVNLLAAVALVWGGVRAHAGRLGGHIVWLAVCLYVPYTYLMYVVAPYNDALLLYIAGIGLGTYGLVDGLVRLDATTVGRAFENLPRRGLAWFFIALATLFAALWLWAILSVWPGGIPEDLFAYDIPSIVHVLDLAIVLPLLAITGVLLLGRHTVAPVLAAMLLVKTLTLGLALLSMNAFVAASGQPVDPGEPIIWSVVVMASVAWLVLFARRMSQPDRAWLRPSIWC
ncbi:hypothetical protein [Egicoccus sp. AB-alg2]|uniref:hypothetical protein n=1 Tax=Egicoccus sp. AB-alg2 TaxID=3242693 RepID=UPI00359EC0A7